MKGLSPRGRGKPSRPPPPGSASAVYPRVGGGTGRPAPNAISPAVYPRVGGGNPPLTDKYARTDGLSPRGRGKRQQRYNGGRPLRSIPAWAGETPGPAAIMPDRTVYPRVGGGNVREVGGVCAGAGLSPRGRGKRQQRYNGGRPLRSIPAWAGETPGPAAIMPDRTVYPRVGGGNVREVGGVCAGAGLSPRGRGKRDTGEGQANR